VAAPPTEQECGTLAKAQPGGCCAKAGTGKKGSVDRAGVLGTLLSVATTIPGLLL